MSKVNVSDVLVRLDTTVEGVTFGTSWWGPKDKMRFAVQLKTDSNEDPEEILRLESIAKRIFHQKISEILCLFE